MSQEYPYNTKEDFIRAYPHLEEAIEKLTKNDHEELLLFADYLQHLSKEQLSEQVERNTSAV